MHYFGYDIYPLKIATKYWTARIERMDGSNLSIGDIEATTRNGAIQKAREIIHKNPRHDIYYDHDCFKTWVGRWIDPNDDQPSEAVYAHTKKQVKDALGSTP